MINIPTTYSRGLPPQLDARPLARLSTGWLSPGPLRKPAAAASLVLASILCCATFVMPAHASTPPTIGAIPNQTVYEDHPTDAYQLALSDAQIPELSLQLSGLSSDTTVVPNENIFFGTANGHWFITVTPAFGRASGSATITVTVSDGTGSASTNFLFTVQPPPAGAARFVNTGAIAIPDGTASPYPSPIAVSGMPGLVTNVNVTLSQFNHERVQDVNMLLVGPGGQGVVIFSHISGGSRSASNVTVYMTDTSLYPLPQDFALWSEPLTPTAYNPPGSFPGPAPAGPYAATAAFTNFNGQSANGTWSLYVYDDTAGATGSISGGWSMTIATDGSNGPQISSIPNQAIAENSSTGPIGFTLSDPNTPLDSLLLSTNSSNPVLVPFSGIVLGGSGSNRTVTVTPANGQTGSATITVGVSDGTNSASASFVVTVSAPATQVRVETAANGSGQVVPSQGVVVGHSVTVYAVARDGGGNFVTNVAADGWSLVNVTGGVVSGDLVPAGDNKSATFTAHAGGSAAIHVTSSGLTSTDSGTLTVITNLPPKIGTIPDKTTLVGIPVGPFPITFSDPETPVGNLQLSGSSSDQTLVPNTNIFLYNNGAQSVTVTPAPGRAGTATITVTVSDGVNNTSTNFLLTVNPGNAQTAIFANSNSLVIPNKSVASVYPATNHVAGMAGLTTKVVLLLTNLTHTSTHDLELLLVGPGGQQAVLFAHAWGANASHVTVAMDDAAFYAMPGSPYPLFTGTYQPTDKANDAFPAPAPGGTYSSNLAAFNGASPVGDWLLYVMNDPTGSGAGSIGGWSLAVTTDTADTAPIIAGLADQSTLLNTAKAINFTVTDAETPADSLLLSASSSNQNLVAPANVVLGGSGTNRTLTITPQSNQVGTATITVIASDGLLSTSNNFVFTVTQGTPVITWSNPGDVVYGTALGGAQLNALADIQGTFQYSPPAGTILGAGSNQALQVTFIPADTTNYTTAVATVYINVNAATPGIIWSNPAGITYGIPLGGTQLNATATVPGILQYNPPAGSVLSAGSNQPLNVTFTPADTTNYNNAFATVYINVGQAIPVLTWTNPADITYGTPLNGAQLNASASVPGNFVYVPPTGAILSAWAQQSLGVNFIPTDTTNYTSAQALVKLNVNPALLTVKADNQTKAYGADVPTLTASYSGFVNGDGTNVLSGSPSLSTTATAGSPVGSYDIVVTNGTLSAANYAFAFVNGTLVVTSTAPTILSLTGAGTTNVVITWTAISNVTYRVQYQSGGGGPSLQSLNGSWTAVVPDVTATNSTASVVDNPNGDGVRFYRIEVLP